MTDLYALVFEAKAKGISLAKIRDKSKLKDTILQDELRRLRSEYQIAGPFKYGRGFLYYAKGYEPGGESVARSIEMLIQHTRNKLATKSQVEEKIRQPFKDFFKDGVRLLVATGRAVELKGGASSYLLHIDAARQLFPNMAAMTAEGEKAKPSLLKEQVLAAYHSLKSEQGGLSAVSIGKLLNRLGCSKEALHQFLLEEARGENADLHPTTLVDLSTEDREGALPIPGKSESAITVTFRE